MDDSVEALDMIGAVFAAFGGKLARDQGAFVDSDSVSRDRECQPALRTNRETLCQIWVNPLWTFMVGSGDLIFAGLAQEGAKNRRIA